MPDSTRPSPGTVLVAAAVVGVADLLYAIFVWVVIYQRSTVQRILQSIASGLLGPASFQGGNATAALGFFVHFVIALGWTLVFLVLLLRWPRLRAWTSSTRGAVLVGLVYGATIWLLMDGVVLPLSRARVVPPTIPWFWIQLAMHPFVVGLPIALILRRGSRHAAVVTATRLPQTAGGDG